MTSVVDTPADAGQLTECFILRTFSSVKPGRVADFMGALTWQAAWLRYHHEWNRVVVGYALTDIPERVLEVYGIPTTDKAAMERTMRSLREQPGYRELIQCCDQEQRAEELLPSMQYETFLNRFVLRRKKRFDQHRELQARKNTEKQQTEAAIITHKKSLENVNKQIDQSTSRTAVPDDTREADVVVVVPSLPDLRKQKKDLEEKIAADTARLTRIEEELKNDQHQAAKLSRFEGRYVPDYFLNVTIQVKPDKLNDYVEMMRKLAKDFDWEFIAAGQHIPEPSPTLPIDIGGQPKLQEHQVMHLWKFGDANYLYQQMVELRENPLFSAVEAMTTKVSQMLMCDWEAISKTKRLPPASDTPEHDKEE